jgi:long-chain fatty acid transport protein
MKKKSIVMAAVGCLMSATAMAGGLMTNTNYHIAFDRMFARGATTEIDGTSSNPAGLVWGHEGLELSLNFQKPWQNRDIDVEIPGFIGNDLNKKYEGVASAPIVPALFATYHKDKWAVSGMIGIVGSGGFVEYEAGVPMFNVPVTAMVTNNIASSPVAALKDDFSLLSSMKGKQYIYGGQVNFAYKFCDYLSAAVGVRVNYYDGYYKGYVTAVPGENLRNFIVTNTLMDLQLNCIQRGWGFTPVVGLNFHKDKWTVAVKYEFRTKIETENDTKQLDINGTDVKAMAEMIGNDATIAALSATALGGMAGKVAGYLPNAKTRYDMPSLLTFAVGYDFTEKLRAAVEYHWYDDKNAKMGGDRQETLSHGTHEILAGVEYDINDKFTVSCGGQRTDYGLTDDYQQNTSFACDSYSIGLGGAWNINEKVRLNVSYFTSIYSDYEKNLTNAYGVPGLNAKETYSRTNHVIGVGIDYKF